MTITISAGQIGNHLIISSGDPLFVRSRGVVADSQILSGGSATLSAGALGEDLAISAGGVLLGPGDLYEEIRDAGSISGATLLANGVLQVLDGGTASGVTVSDQAILDVDAGAAAGGDDGEPWR